MAPEAENKDLSTPPPGKLTTKERLNSRTAPYTLSSDAGPNTDSSSASSAESRTTCKAASPANLQPLAKIPRLQLPPVAPVAEGVQTGAANSPATNGRTEDADTPVQPPNQASGSPTSSRGGTGVASRGAPRGTARGSALSARGGRGSGSGGSSRPSTSAAAYSNVAAAPKNFLIHIYKSRNELLPFLRKGDFNNICDIIKAAIWASYAEHGVDRDLSVNIWVYKRLKHEMGIGLIFCASEARQRRVIRLILDIGLSSHIVETAADVNGGMKMSFKQPIFGPQRIDLLLAAIWELNDLMGKCSTTEMGVDCPKDGNPYMVWTVHFPVNVVEYAEQRNFRLAGSDGIIFLYGNDVTAHRRANFKAAEARRCEE
jgi:hypothetical protein